MDWKTFLQQIANQKFLSHLEASPPPEQKSCLPFLRLLKTGAIRDWASQSVTVQKRAEVAAFVGSLLLERLLLHPRHRRQSAELSDYWRTVVARRPGLANLWDEAGLPETLDPTLAIPEQEERFARVLADAAERLQLESGPPWAIDTLRKLARQRGLLGRESAANAAVRVVFGWEPRELASGALAPDLRAGLLNTFTLLAESGYDVPVNSPHVFDASFIDAIREEVRRRVHRAELRNLDHDWGFLGDGVLTGTSGTLAIWLAQFLAAGGLRDRRWTLPPWVVVTATLDRAGNGTGGAAGLVGLLREKTEVLIEEGVRVMLVATKDADVESIRRQFDLNNVPGADDLLILPLRVSEDDVADVARELHTRKLLWPVTLDAFGNPPTRVTPEADAELIDARQQPHVVVSTSLPSEPQDGYTRRLRELEDDYVPPVFALQAIEEALQQLPGHGYLHMTAPAMWGKSFLVLALRHGWKPDEASAALGQTISYAVLHGRPENAGDFLYDVYEQAKTLSGGRPLRDLPEPHRQRTIDDMRLALREVLKLAKQHRCSPGQPLVLAVDALDELTDDDTDMGRSLILNYLPRADELPDGCYILLTSRPHLRPRVWRSLADRLGVAIVTRSVSEVFPAQTLADLASAMYRRIDFEITNDYRQLLRDFLLASFGEPIEPHIETILTHGRERFLYVRFLRDLLRLRIAEQGDAVLRDLRPGDLPDGDAVFPTYLDWLARTVALKHNNPNLFREWYRPVLLQIAAAYEPVTRKHLRCWLGPRDWDDQASHLLNLALDELAPLLTIERPSDLPDDSRFTLAHREFLDWLRNNSHLAWQTALRDVGHRRIVDSGERHTSPPMVDQFTTVDVYHLLHVPSHWLDLDDTTAAWAVLSEPQRIKLVDSLAESFRRRWQWSAETEIYTVRIQQLERLVVAAGGEAVAVKSQKSLVNHLASVHMKWGGTLDKQADFGAATATYDRADALYQIVINAAGGKEQAATNDSSVLHNLARLHNDRAWTLLRQSEFKLSINGSELAISILERLLRPAEGEEQSEGEQSSLLNDLAAAHMHRGVALRNLGRSEEALLAYDAATELRKRFVRDAGGAKQAANEQKGLVNDLAAVNVNRGVALRSLGRNEEAVGAYARAIRLRRLLVAVAGGEKHAVKTEKDLINTLAGAYVDLGVAFRYLNRFDEALAAYARAIDLREQLVQDAGGETQSLREQVGLITSLAGVYVNRGMTLYHLERFDEALKAYTRAIILREQLIRGSAGRSAVKEWISLTTSLAYAYVNRGKTLHKQGITLYQLKYFKKALRAYKRAIDLHEQLQPKHSLGYFLEAIRNMILLHEDLQDRESCIGNVMQAVNRCVMAFNAVGNDLARPNVRGEFTQFDELVSQLKIDLQLDAETRNQWKAVRQLFDRT